MENLDESVKINHNPNWPHIPDHPYKILINGGFRSEKTYASLNLRNQKLDLNKKKLLFKDPCESKYQLLINKKQKVEIHCLKN